MQNKKHTTGFTLVELMVVVVIIAILVAIGLPIFTKMRDTSRHGSIAANLKSLYNAAHGYFADNPTVASVDYETLTTGNYITLTPIAGESYTGLTIVQNPTSEQTISVSAGSMISNSSLQTVTYTYN